MTMQPKISFQIPKSDRKTLFKSQVILSTMFQNIADALQKTAVSHKKSSPSANLSSEITAWINQNQSHVVDNISKGFNPMPLPKDLNQMLSELDSVSQAQLERTVNAELNKIAVSFKEGAFSRSLGTNSMMIQFNKK